MREKYVDAKTGVRADKRTEVREEKAGYLGRSMGERVETHSGLLHLLSASGEFCRERGYEITFQC